MARASSSSTKFASVNLNKSYGKPASQGTQLPSSGSSRSRITTHGGMLLLTRPTVRSQPAAAAAQKGAKLAVPRPVNLPSLRREHAGNDPTIALVGGTGASGWTKQQQKESEEEAVNAVPGENNIVVSRSTPALSSGSTWATSQALPNGPTVVQPAYFTPVNGDLRPTSSPQAVARSGVYTPPRARTAQASTGPPASGPQAVPKAVVLRGEDFPTLQAALPPPPAPPQYRQKELQQKQRAKQQELKDQQEKLQQLSQKQPLDEPLRSQVGGPQLQPSQPVSLQPQREQPLQPLSKESSQSSEGRLAGQVGTRTGSKSDGASSFGPVLPSRVNHRSNWTDDEREPSQSLRPQSGSGSYSDRPDRSERERENFIEDPRRGSRTDEYGFGRQSSQIQPPYIRESGFNREGERSRENGFASDVGIAREGNPISNLSSDNGHREATFIRDGMGSRDGHVGRDGGIPRERSYGKDGGHGRDSGVSRDGGFGREGGFSRHGTFGRDGNGREFGPGKDRNMDREGYGRPRSGGRDFGDREAFSFKEGFGKESGPRDVFNRDASYGRDISGRDGPYGRDGWRPSAGEYEGSRGRYGGDRFGRGSGNRYDAVPDKGNSKANHFAPGRGVMALDAGLDFSRDKRFGVPYSEDSFARDFPDLPGFDIRTSSGLGIDALGLGLEAKLGRKKKDELKDFHDPERESFEAELERVQKAQEQERLRKIEEKERAVEMARKEQEEQERLAREEEERQRRLEEEAIAAAKRAKLEETEAARKVEEDRRAREEEKRQIQLEEERRKENARRKLLELEERIAKREAERKKQEAGPSLFSEDDIFRPHRVDEEEAAFSREDAAREEEERIVASITEADHDDDDRAPLRPSRRPHSPFISRPAQDDYPSRLKSPDVQQHVGPRRMPDLRGGNAFEPDRSRSFMTWRRDSTDNGSGPLQASGRDEGNEIASVMARDRMYNARNYGDRDPVYGTSNSALTGEGGSGDYPLRRERNHGYPERRWIAEESGSNKRSASPRATSPERDGGYLELSYDREGDRHWGREKTDRRRFREGQRISSPPHVYLQGTDALEPSYGGRLRHSFAKQPRVPPPLRTPLLRPPLKAPRDQSNSSPSPLLHPVSDEDRDSSWDQGLGQDKQHGYPGHTASRLQQAERPLSHAEVGHRGGSYGEKYPSKEWQSSSPSSLSPRPAQSQPSRTRSDSQDDKSDQQSTGMDQEPLSAEDDSSLSSETPVTHHDDEDVASEGEALPSAQRVEERKSDEVYEEDDTDAEGMVDDRGEEDFGDTDDYPTGEWEEDAEEETQQSEVVNDETVAEEFISEEYESGPQESKEGSSSEVDSHEEEEKAPEGLEESAISVKLVLERDTDHKELPEGEVGDDRTQHDGIQQSTGQLYQVALPSSQTPSTSVASVQVTSSENRQSLISQLPQPLSFMALSVPQNHATVTASQVPSVLTSLPVLHSTQEGPVTLQFGLLPSTPLVPTSVSAIQIGSIQMPLHLHPQAGPQFTPLYEPQGPLFQFGQLGHPTSMPAFSHPSSVSQSLAQSQMAETRESQSNGPSVQGGPSAASHDNDQFVASQAENQGSASSRETNWSNRTSRITGGGPRLNEGENVENRVSPGNALRPERRSREKGSREAGTQGVQTAASHAKAVHRLSSEGALESSSPENSIIATTENIVDSGHGGDSSWQRPHSGGRGVGNAARWGTPSSRGRGRSGAYGGRGAPQPSSEGYVVAAGSHSQDTGTDGGLLRGRPGRRSSFRRTEFKVRESSTQGFSDGSGPAKLPAVRDKFASWTDNSVLPGNLSDSAGSKESYRDSSSQAQERYREGGGRSSHNSSGKPDRSGSNEGFQKNGRGSGYAVSRPAEGVLGKYSSEVGSESLQGGIRQPLEHLGTDAPSDEDDFIEVRSKRQMLSDRREQKEKEMKAKTKDLKAKEQAARKQRPPPPKASFQGASTSFGGGGGGGGSKAANLSVAADKRSGTQSGSLDSSNSNSSRLLSSANPQAGASSSIQSSVTQPQLQAPIGTPSGGPVDVAYDKRTKNTKPARTSSAQGVILPDNDVTLTNSASYETQENVSTTSLAWGGTRSTLQVVSLTQIQLEEAMKPVRFDGPVAQLPLGERSSLVLEPGTSVSSATAKEKTPAAVSGPIGSLLAGEKIQFGAVTSPPIPLTNSRPLTPGLNAVVGSSLGSRAEESSEDNDLKNKSQRLPVRESDVGSFAINGKGKRTRGEDGRNGEGVDPEAEAEAAASAVAVAAISSDESVGSSLHGDVKSMPLRGVGISGSGSKNAFGSSSVTSMHSEYWPAATAISMGDSTSSSVMMQVSGLEESMTVALPADLSVEPTSMSLRGPAPSSAGLLLPSMQGGPLPFRGLEMGSMLGGPMFGFGASKDAPQGGQGPASGSGHEQGITSAGPGSGGWQPQLSGGVDSFYAGPAPTGFAGPFINPAGGIPSLQGGPHMLVYTNPFAPVSQFGQLGVSFMGPQQYMPSGKQPDWKHTPVTSSGAGVVGMSGNEVGGGLGGIMSNQRSSGVASNVQRMAPGPSVMPTPGPFDLNLSAPFQIPGVDVSIQSQWSHVPGPPLHTVPISGPLMSFTMQGRHSRGPGHLGHLPHMMETTSGFNVVPAASSGSSGMFQSVDPASQFPDELGLGDSSSSGTNTSSSFRGQRPASRNPPVSNSVVSPTGGSGATNNKLRNGRRSSRVARAGGSLGGGGNGTGNVQSVGMAAGSGQSAPGSNGSRVQSPHHPTSSQMPAMSMGQHTNPNQYADQRGGPQQGLSRVGIQGGWSGQGRKGGGPGRPPVTERGPSGERAYVSSSSKLKQVYVVKPSSSPRRNIGEAASNLFSGPDVSQTTVGH
ncbi:hypothetical protein R1sor_021279 [Riccia sorocarpa]|uniref:BAT2 N-terminal domain-containing protein n=1 Tax=Riccia sorocarpa TaxID=122646 RepID=A0ABD3GHD9_9MARC